METRKTAVVLVAALVLLVQPVEGQVITAAIPIGLGFSQGTVLPLTSGVPVYTIGDQLWFEAYSAGPVDVIVTPPVSGGSGSVLSAVGVPGNESQFLLTFSSQDPPGLWSLTVSNATGAQTMVEFYLVGGNSPLTMTGYGVDDDGLLSLNYTLQDSSAYSISTCTAGNGSTSTAYVPIPASDGGGMLLLTLNGSSVSAFPDGNKAQFKFWLGLDQRYAYETTNQTVVTRDENVAVTQPVTVLAGSGGAFTTALQQTLPLGTGQFTLVSNFDGRGGMSVQQTTVLLTGTGSWVWLQDCSASSNPVSTHFTVTTPLSTNPSLWPRDLYVLYTVMGLSLFTAAQVDVQPSTIHLMASGWDAQLTDSQIEVSGATRYSAGGGTVYVVSAEYPLTVSIDASRSYSQPVTIRQPYSTLTAQMPAAQVVVETSYGGEALSGVPVMVSNALGAVASQTSAGGEAVFYLPPGEFNITASYQGQAQVVRVGGSGSPLLPGQSYTVPVQFVAATSSPAPVFDSYVLLAALFAGMVLSALVWGLAYRRRKPPVGAGAGWLGRVSTSHQKENRGHPGLWGA